MTSIDISRWNHNIGLGDPHYSLVLRDSKISDKILRALKLKEEKENLVFPFFSLLDPNKIVGAFTATWNKKQYYQGLTGRANDYLYPLCVPNVDLDPTKLLHLVRSPLSVAEYLSDNKNAIAFCRDDKISDSLVEYIINNDIKEIKCVGLRRSYILERNLYEAGHNCLVRS
jgi:hypothetical protein